MSGRRITRRWIFLLTFSAIVCAGAGFAAPPVAAQGKPTQYDVKAAYLYNFGKFIRWPSAPSDSFNICILGDNPFGDGLANLVKGETLNGQRVEVKRINAAQSASGCSIVYVSSSEQGHTTEITTALAAQHALTVSDIPHFIDKGGMIGFVSDGGRIRFEVNQKAAQNAGLTLSSELLKVAVTVKKGDR